jgi:hypothetical protein
MMELRNRGNKDFQDSTISATNPKKDPNFRKLIDICHMLRTKADSAQPSNLIFHVQP